MRTRQAFDEPVEAPWAGEGDAVREKPPVAVGL